MISKITNFSKATLSISVTTAAWYCCGNSCFTSATISSSSRLIRQRSIVDLTDFFLASGRGSCGTVAGCGVAGSDAGGVAGAALVLRLPEFERATPIDPERLPLLESEETNYFKIDSHDVQISVKMYIHLYLCKSSSVINVLIVMTF